MNGKEPLSEKETASRSGRRDNLNGPQSRKKKSQRESHIPIPGDHIFPQPEPPRPPPRDLDGRSQDPYRRTLCGLLRSFATAPIDLVERKLWKPYH
jgi:hypothetical protein